MMRCLRIRLESFLDRTLHAFGVLMLPLALLLFLQWPLRDVVQAYSREANDLAQIIFALYASLAITAASRRHVHLGTNVVASLYSPRLQRHLKRLASLLVLVPWSVFMLWSAWPEVWQSLRGLERFPETTNPGYFLVKVAVMILSLGILLQSLIDGLAPAQEHQKS